MKIVIFDVSNGLCALAVCNNGYSLMIDCGSHGDRPNPIDVINELRQPNKFLSHMVDHSPYSDKAYPLTLLSISHPDEDHIRNVEELIRRFPPALLHRRRLEDFPSQSLSTGAKLDLFRELLCDVYRGNDSLVSERPNWAFDRSVFQIPMEIVTTHPNFEFGKVTNNSSIITLLEYQDKKILFGGDLETVGWEWLLENDQRFRAAIADGVDILVAPHHGHKSAFPGALFEIAGPPRLSVLSKGSEFGDNSDVDPRYSSKSVGMAVNVLSNDALETKYSITSRRNGQTFLDFTAAFGITVYTEY